jgi:uncharacterized membrane protein
VDHTFLILNGLLLLTVTFVPYPTALVGEHLGHPDGRLAVLMFGGTMVVSAIFWNLLWRYAASGRRLIGEDVPDVRVREIDRQFRLAPFIYLTGTLLALWSPLAAIAVFMGLAIFFALPAGMTSRPRDERG